MPAQPPLPPPPAPDVPHPRRPVQVDLSPQPTAPPSVGDGPVAIPPCFAAAAFARALHAVLTDLYSALRTCTQHHYHTPASRAFMNATLGGHIRHTLDHITPLLRALDAPAPAPIINYDLRSRGTPIERDLRVALDELAHTIAHLSRPLPEHPHELTVALMPAATEPAVLLHATLERELAFALSHTIHHCAAVRGILTEFDLPFPHTLGYAPSTLRSLQSGAACAH